MVVDTPLQNILKNIKAGELSSGRIPGSVKLVAVAKYTELSDVESVVSAGITHIAENQVQKAERWISCLLKNKINLHMIGHLQGNKVKPALKIFNSIDTVHSKKLADRIENLAENIIDVMIEVNISGEENKHGCTIDEFNNLSSHILSLNRLRLTGVFTMCPFSATGIIRESIYNKASQLAGDLERRVGRSFERSYGMSDDYQLAIKCGATQVRLGRILFGGM